MALLNAGYWPTTYWPADYWNPKYWPKYGTPPVTYTGISPPRRRLRKRVVEPLPPELLRLVKQYLQFKLGVSNHEQNN